MSEPMTEAGRRMYARWGSPNFLDEWNAAIRAIESEAVVSAWSDVKRLAEAVLEYDEWDEGGGCRYCVHATGHDDDCITHLARRLIKADEGSATPDQGKGEPR